MLNYPPIDQIDWLKWCDCDSVKIVFCLKVIDELDEKKNHETLGERAKNAIKKIEDISNNQSKIKENVLLGLHNIDLEVPNSSADEIIVQQVLDYKKSFPKEDVYILSEDLGMKLRCNQRIALIKPDTNDRLQSPSSELHKKNKQLQRKIESLENQVPDLNLIITGDEKFELENILPFVAKFESIPLLEEETIKEELSKYNIPQLRLLGIASMFYSSDAINNYENALYKWRDEINKAITRWNKSFNFCIHVRNSGSKPANNISVTITFPKIFQFLICDKKHFGKVPASPSMPSPPVSHFSIAPLNISDTVPKFMPPMFPDMNGPFISFKKDDSNIFLNIEIKKITHYSYETFECTGGLQSLDELKSFNVKATLLADETPHRKAIEIPFLFG